MNSSNSGLLSKVSALEKKLSLYRDSPFQRKGKDKRGSRTGSAPAEEQNEGPDQVSEEKDHENSINITV